MPSLIPQVLVRARVHIAEEIGGSIRRFAPGEEFTVDEIRADALGALVERIPTPTAG